MTASMSAFLRALLRSKAATFGAVVIVIFVVTALLVPFLDFPNVTRGDLRMRMMPPTISLHGLGTHPFGTDQLGRDILSRIAVGAGTTLSIGMLAVVFGGIVGILLGLLAAQYGGMLDRLIMRLADMQFSIPLMLLALVVIAAAGPSIHNLVLVLALTGWVRFARLVRGQALAIRERDFIQSAHAIGASSPRIMFRHLLPNVMTPILVVATLELARVIILEASLSFLGFGVPPPAPSWGRMLAEGRTYIGSAWWMVTFPGLAVTLTVLSVNLVGDWLRDYFDPKLVYIRK